MVKLLVAGADGGLGRAVCARADATYEVVALGRRGLDVARRNEVMERLREIRPDVVVDAAGVSDPEVCEHDRWRAYLVNRDGADHLARAAAEIGALMVYPSCAAVFDGARRLPYREEDSPNPISVFGDTKLAGELAVMSQCPRHLVLRVGRLYGPHGRNLVKDLLARREAVVTVDEECVDQPTSQEAFADVLLKLASRGQTGVWHVAAEGEGTEMDLARLTLSAAGDTRTRLRGGRSASGGRRVLRPKYGVFECRKLNTAGIRLGSWKEALTAFVKSELSRKT